MPCFVLLKVSLKSARKVCGLKSVSLSSGGRSSVQNGCQSNDVESGSSWHLHSGVVDEVVISCAAGYHWQTAFTDLQPNIYEAIPDILVESQSIL